MIRAVLTVALALALVGASMPAIESVRADRTATVLGSGIDDIRRAAAALVDHEAPTETGVSGARRVVTLDLPESSWTAVGVDAVVIRGDDGADSDVSFATVEYTLDTGRTDRVRLDVPLRTPGGPLLLGGGQSNERRLVLTLVRTDSDPDPDPVVVATRG